MAIYIPGALGIPEKGAKYICIRADGTVTNLHGDPLGVTAVEVPDHGRLGDLDAFLARNAYFADREFVNPKYDDTLKDLVDAAPTIIPADPPDPAEEEQT